MINDSAYLPPRHVRIAALAYLHKHALDRDDFLLLVEAFGLDDLLTRQ